MGARGKGSIVMVKLMVFRWVDELGVRVPEMVGWWSGSNLTVFNKFWYGRWIRMERVPAIRKRFNDVGMMVIPVRDENEL